MTETLPSATPAVLEPLPLDAVDLADLDNFTDGVTPWRMFHTLRHEDPVHWQPEEAPNSGFWAVTRHADIARVDRDAETFTSTKFVNLEEVDEDQIKKRASILELDGVRHRALRSVIQRQFGAGVINSYTDFLRGLTAQTLDAALAKGSFDFVKEVSADFPINVLARLLDVPPEDNQQLIDWGNRIIGNTDPDYADVLLHSAESEKYRDLPFRSPASLEVFEYGRSWPGSGAAARAPTWSPSSSTPPRATECRCPRGTSTTTSCSWWSPATRPPGTPSPTPCWPSSSTPNSSPVSRPTRP